MWRGGEGTVRAAQGAAYLQHCNGARAVHLEVRGQLRARFCGLVGTRVAEAGVGDIQAAQRERVLWGLEVVEVAAARVKHKPAAAVAAQRAFARQLLQVAAQPRRPRRALAAASATALLSTGSGTRHRPPARQPQLAAPNAPPRGAAWDL